MEPTDTDGSEPVLRLRIPEPNRGWDPSERVRRHLNTSVEMRKPPLDEKVERIALMRKRLVRVLDDDDKAHGRVGAGPHRRAAARRACAT